ncbi:hypothetical protein KY284_005085 [Solanum tuberosum]|nr:hypothetical protein KY284_005085 [Solanum tuberosum]
MSFVFLRYNGSQKKERNKTCPPTTSQSEGHDDSETIGSEDTPPQSEEGGGSSDNGEDSESQSDVVAGSQFADSSGGSAKSASGSPEDTNTSPSVGNTEVETGPNPALRPQLIACYRSMWIVNRSEEFFNNGIVNKTGSFKKWTIMPETRVVGPLNSIIVRGKSVDISEATVNRMLHGPEYSSPASVGLFEGNHHEVTSDTSMEIQSSREKVLHWIAKKIAIDRENVVWVTTMPTLITKASLSFPSKVWWAVVRAQLRPTGNDNTLYLSLVSLVACLMAGYPVSKIKDVVNHLFGAKSAAVGTLAVVHHVPLEIPQTDKCTKQGESSQLSTDVPPPPVSAPRLQLIETKVLAAKKEIQDKMRKELVVLKDRMDGLENIVQDRCQAACSVEFEEFKSQLAEMRTQIAKLAEKPVQVPTPIMLESLMQMLTQAPSTQSIDDLWGEIPTSKFDKRKHKTRELDEETPIDPVREAKRQEKRARRTSKREAREKETLEQQQRDASLVGASSNGAPARTSEDQPDQVPSSESTPIDKGVNVDSKTGA